jgi:hypothetical protein
MTNGRVPGNNIQSAPPEKRESLKGIKRCFYILEVSCLFLPVINSHAAVQTVDDTEQRSNDDIKITFLPKLMDSVFHFGYILYIQRFLMEGYYIAFGMVIVQLRC